MNERQYNSFAQRQKYGFSNSVPFGCASFGKSNEPMTNSTICNFTLNYRKRLGTEWAPITVTREDPPLVIQPSAIYHRHVGQLPKYGGHIPGAQFRFGRTYGNDSRDAKRWLRENKLKFAYYISLPLIKWKILRHFMTVVFIWHCFFCFFHARHCLENFNLNFFCKYFHSFAIVTYGMVCIICRKITWDEGQRLYGALPYVCVDMYDVSPTTQKRINRRVTVLKLYYAATYFVFFGLSTCYLTASNSDGSFIFAQYIIKERFPAYENVLFRIYCISLIILRYQMFEMTSFLGYFINQCVLEAYALSEMISNFKGDGWDRLDERELYYDQSYQKYIETEIKIMLKKIELVLRCFIKGREVVKKCSFLILIFGAMICISDVFESFKVEFTPMELIKAFFTLSFGALMGGYLVFGGQSIEDGAAEIIQSSTYNDWYTWNKKNKMLFLTTFTMTRNIFKFSISPVWSINYELGVQVVKGIYSLTTALLHLREVGI